MSMIVYLWIISFISVYLALFWILAVTFLRFEDRKRLKDYPTITIGIPVWNEEKTIVQTLKSLAFMDYPKDKLEVIIVDDGSQDKTLALVKNYARSKSYIHVFKNEKNLGKSHTMNRILSLAKSEYFAVFDADSSVDKDYLKKALSYFTNDNVAAVASQIKVRNPRTLIEKIQRVEMLFGSFMRRLMLLIGTQHFTNGVMSLFRTDILRSVGGFSDKVMTEDLEIAIRLRSLGYDVRICEDAYGYTKMPNTFKGLWIQRVRWYRGFIQSYLLHRKMLGNKSFGLLGLFQLPLGVFSLVIVLLSALVLIYQLFDFLYKQFNWLIGIEGHIFSDFNLPKFSDFLFGMNFKVLFPALVAIFIGLYLYIKAHRHMGEKWKYTISSMIYIFLYPVLLGLQLWHACFAEIFRMKRRWR